MGLRAWLEPTACLGAAWLCAAAGPDRREHSESLYVSPGVRWAHNFRSGLQIVPGLAVPLGIGASAGEQPVFAYLSFEHPFARAPA